MYRVTARVVESKCAHVKVGHKIVIEGPLVNLKETDSLCATALASMNHALYMMKKTSNPREFGRADAFRLRCPDAEDGVTFEITRELIDA